MLTQPASALLYALNSLVYTVMMTTGAEFMNKTPNYPPTIQKKVWKRKSAFSVCIASLLSIPHLAIWQGEARVAARQTSETFLLLKCYRYHSKHYFIHACASGDRMESWQSSAATPKLMVLNDGPLIRPVGFCTFDQAALISGHLLLTTGSSGGSGCVTRLLTRNARSE